jgi:hypothetical protein
MVMRCCFRLHNPNDCKVASFFKCGKLFFLWLSIMSLTGCFGSGIDMRGSVRDYRNGVVYTEGGRFRVGVPSKNWQKESIKYRAVMFSHKVQNASMGVDAFCKRSLDDGPLKVLANQLFYGMTKQKRLRSSPLSIDGRKALRATRRGIVDGVPMVLDVVVLKRDECVFDFFATASPKEYPFISSDFETFFKGFYYIDGP